MGLIGLLIGKKGETIKAISKRSSARIKIDNSMISQKSDKRTITFYGSPDAIQRARTMIEETLRGSREEAERAANTNVDATLQPCVDTCNERKRRRTEDPSP